MKTGIFPSKKNALLNTRQQVYGKTVSTYSDGFIEDGIEKCMKDCYFYLWDWPVWPEVLVLFLLYNSYLLLETNDFFTSCSIDEELSIY